MNFKPKLLSAVIAGTMAVTSVAETMPILSHSLTAFAAETSQTFSEDTKLTSDMTYSGDVRISGGTFDLNGHTLTVGGNFTQTEGILRLTHGTLRVKGNMTLRYGGGPGHGRFECDYEDDVIDVDGNVLIDTDCESAPWQDDGVFRIGGNLTVGSGGVNYAATYNHVTEFKGSETHIVNFSESEKNNLNIVKQSGTGEILIQGNTTGFKLGSDLVLADGSTFRGDRTLDLNKFNMTVNGDFNQYGSLLIDASGNGAADSRSDLTVTGNYNQPEGKLYPGNVKIGGDYVLRYGGGVGHGRFTCDYENSVIDVDGNVLIDTDCESVPYQDDGVLRIGGNLSVGSGGANYIPTYSHVTEFKGEKTHTVSFAESEINYLNLVKQTGTGEIFIQGETTGFKLGSDLVLADGSTFRGNRTLDLNKFNMTVNGDFYQYGSLIIDACVPYYKLSSSERTADDMSTMTVTGNYSQPEGVLRPGIVKIGGNYVLRYGGGVGHGRFECDYEDSLIDVDGNVLIDTDCESVPYQDNGVLRIGGDLSVGSGGANYIPTYDHVTEFKGEKTHNVSFAESDINHLNIVKQPGEGEILTKDSTTGFKLGSDLVLASGSSFKGSWTLDLNGFDMTVNGEFYQNGPLLIDARLPYSYLSSENRTADDMSKLTVKGNYSQPEGVLYPGIVKIGGNYTLRYGGGVGHGRFACDYKDSLIDVDGNVKIDTDCESVPWQDDGVLRIGGDLDVGLGGANYQPTGDHITEFKGGVVHNVSFADTKNYLKTIKLGIDDSISFTNKLMGAERSGSTMTVTPSTIATVADTVIKAAASGEGFINIVNGSTTVKRALIVGKGGKAPTETTVTTSGGKTTTTKTTVTTSKTTALTAFTTTDPTLSTEEVGVAHNYGPDARVNPHMLVSNPKNPCEFTVAKDCKLVKIFTYHRGKVDAGKLSLYEDGEFLGKWDAQYRDWFSDNDCRWFVMPEGIILRKGRVYTIEDSDTSTWLCDEDGCCGLFLVSGIYINGSAVTTTAQTTKVTTTAATTITMTTTAKSAPVNNDFKWGRDNWNFLNSKDYFKNNYYRIDDKYLKVIRSKVSNTEYQKILYNMGEKWEGSCYGMASLVAAARQGLKIPYSSFSKGSDSIYSVQTPDKNNDCFLS